MIRFSELILFIFQFPSKKRAVVNASEESVVGFARHEGTQESYEMTTNISYREDPNLLHLPQKVVARKTPPPPYDNSANGLTTIGSSISGNEIGEAQLTIHTLDDDGLSTNRGYYELEENNVHRNGEARVTHRLINYDAAVQAQTSPKLIASLDKSPTSSNEIKQQRVANSQFLLQAQEQATIDASRSSFRDENHGFVQASINPERSPRPAVRVKRIPSTTLKRKLNTRISMSQSDLDSETRKSSPLNSNAEIHSNCDIDGSSQVSQSNWNDQVRTSHSSLTPEMTPRFLRRSAEVRTSHMNFKPAVIPRTSQSSLNIQNSLENANSENEKPGSVSNLNKGRQQFPSRSNWLLPTDRRFISHSNLNMDSGQSFASQSNSNSEAPHCSSRINTESNISPGNSRSNIADVDTQSHVKNLKKIYQPEQFVARSNDAPSLHKARSFGSLAVNASKTPQVETGNLQNFGDGNALANNHNSNVPGRSTESVLDASKKSKQMTPQEWMSAWNHGFHKMPSADAERIVGVRL